MAAAARAVAVAGIDNGVMGAKMRRPFASLLSQVYGKPVEFKLQKLDRPHLDSSILAAVAAERMRDRTMQPRPVHRDLVTKPDLPRTQDVLNSAEVDSIAINSLKRKPSLRAVGDGRSSVKDVLRELNLKKVSSITLRIGGRYGRRLTADQAAYKIARKGLTSKGASYVVRNVRRSNIAYATRAGKRKVGAFGIKVWLGHHGRA